MNFDPGFIGPQDVTDEDRRYAGSRFADVRAALFENSYYLTWGGTGEPPLPMYDVTFSRVLCGLLPGGEPWHFREAARRAITSHADLRWGPDRRGFRRLLHPNGVCLLGKWIIDRAAPGDAYTGYFRKESEALIVARYSTCCTETRRGRYRSLSLVGKLFPTTDPQHTQPLWTANFITQEDLGGAKRLSIDQAELRNAPDTTPWRRGFGLPTLLLTGLTFKLTDEQPTFRQVYDIAELGKPAEQPTNSPNFLRLLAEPEAAGQPSAPIPDDLDFRDEVLGRIYDRGHLEPKRKLIFHIEVSNDDGVTKGKLLQRRTITNWQRIGRIEFTEAVASYNGDFVIHFHHSPWRHQRNDPATLARQ